MRKIFVLLLAVTLSTSAMASYGSDQSQPKKQEQRKSKKSDKKTAEINRAFEILKSGRFKISVPVPREVMKAAMTSGVGYDLVNGAVARTKLVLDIQNPSYTVTSAEIDSVKNTYVVTFTYQYKPESSVGSYNVVYNFKTGYLRALPFSSQYSIEGNYTYVLPLDE